MLYVGSAVGGLESAALGFRATREWASWMVALLRDRSTVVDLFGDPEPPLVLSATVAPRLEVYEEGLPNVIRELSRLIGTSEIAIVAVRCRSHEGVQASFSADELALSNSEHSTFARFSLEVPAVVKPGWLDRIVQLFIDMIGTANALGGWGHMVRDSLSVAGPRTMRFGWPRPLGVEAMGPVVEFYGWLTFIPSSLVDLVGGADGLHRAQPLVVTHEVRTVHGTGIVARLGPDPWSLTAEQLWSWRATLLPAMVEVASFVPGQIPGDPHPGVLAEDW